MKYPIYSVEGENNAIKIYNSQWWKGVSPEEATIVQLFIKEVITPFGKFSGDLVFHTLLKLFPDQTFDDIHWMLVYKRDILIDNILVKTHLHAPRSFSEVLLMIHKGNKNKK